jgi:AcrR family transcriptional regulator
VSRTANSERPEELLSAIVRYLGRHGLADLSLRPLAKAVGSSPRVLLYYFGSKEQMIIRILEHFRERQRISYDRISAASLADACRIVWKRMSAPASLPLFRIFFEAYGIALRQPRRYKDFLRATIEDWLNLIADPLVREGHPRADARALATVILAGLRGFMLDYCNTRDRPRIDRAVDLWLETLDTMLPNLSEAS